MSKGSLGISRANTEKVSLDGLNWLTSEEKAQVKRVFDSANLTDVIDQEITEQAANSLNITVEETDDSNEESTTLKFLLKKSRILQRKLYHSLI
jgi:hypothetical protein